MPTLNEGDILTKIVRYNLIRNERLIYIDVHETKAGSLAGKFVAVPNLINIVGLTTEQPGVLQPEGRWFEAIPPERLEPQNIWQAQRARRLPP